MEFNVENTINNFYYILSRVKRNFINTYIHSMKFDTLAYFAFSYCNVHY